MNTTQSFKPLQLTVTNWRSYLFAVIFIAGNLITPQLVHGIPRGGLIFLPIYFFTLIAAYKFGLHVGLLTAVLSPLVNNWLFGMPPSFVLPAILIKSCLLAIVASTIAKRYNKVSPWLLLLVVLGYQIPGSIIECITTQSITKGFQDFKIGLPGMLIQIVGGWLILKQMAGYEKR
jgi:hypothetical protein